MKKLFLLTACAATLWLAQACSSVSETTTVTDSTATDTTSVSTTYFIPDTVFMAKAAVGGMAEVEFANFALLKSTNAEIKNFATMMVTDHTKANEELMAIAKEKGFNLPKILDAEHQAKSDQLRDLTGAAFDKAYAATMVEAHQKTLDLMKTEAANGIDANLKDFAAKTATVVQAHLEHAQKLQGNVK